MSKAAGIALGLWAATIAGLVYLFIYGTTVGGSDGRVVVILTAGERNQVLAEMRSMLEAIAAITGAIGRGDRVAIAKAAEPVGTVAMAADSPAVLGKLPLGMKTAGLAVHQGFDALAAAAAAGTPTERLLGMLSDQLTVCAGCHASYRLAD